MTEKVVDILTAKPHIQGDCICLGCKHEWVGVFPLGVHSLECSQCGMMKGVHKGLAVPEQYWMCNCGCSHFFVSATTNILCCFCGKIQEFPRD